MTTEELREFIANLSLSIKELQKSQAETAKETAKQRSEEKERSRKLDLRFKKVLGEFEGVKKSNGQMSEDFFYTSLDKNKKLGGIQYDEVEKNWKYKSKALNLEDEYDIIMINGKDLAVVEVKYKADSQHIKQLKRKIRNFPLLYPEYKNYTLHGAIAGLTISPQTEEKFLENGYSVIKAQGDHIEISNPEV